MRNLRLFFLTVAFATALLVSLLATAGSAQCPTLQIAIDAILKTYPAATVRRLTADEARRFGPADAGALFERPDVPTVYVLLAQEGCVRVGREFRAAFVEQLLWAPE